MTYTPGREWGKAINKKGTEAAYVSDQMCDLTGYFKIVINISN